MKLKRNLEFSPETYEQYGGNFGAGELKSELGNIVISVPVASSLPGRLLWWEQSNLESQ